MTLVAVGQTDITATYAGDNTYAGSVGTYQLNVTNSDPNVPGTANNPYTVADIIEMGTSLPSGTVYVSGIVSSFFGDNILGDGTNYRYYISEDGVEENEIRVYKGNGLNNQAFAHADDVLIGDHVVICGELSIYSNMTQFNAGNYIYSLFRPASYTLTVSSLDHAAMSVFAGNESEMLFEGEGSGSVVEGASVILSVEPENGYELTSLMVNGVEHVNDINGGAYVFNMPGHDVEVTVTTTRLPYYTVNFTTDGVADGSIEVTQGQPIATLPTATAELIPNGYTFVGWYTDNYTNATTAPNYVTSAFVPTSDITLKAVFAVATGTPATLTKMTSSDSFTAGDNVVIVAVGEDYAFAMYQQTKSNSYVDKYAFDGDVAKVAANDKNWLTVSAGSTSDTWKLGDATNGYVYNSSSNDLAVSTDNSTDFSLAWNADNDGFTLAGNNRYLSYRYDLANANKYFRMGGANLGTSGNVYFDIYKYVAGSASYSDYKTSSTAEYSVFTLEIDGYGAEYDPETNNNAGYYLIASPVNEAITPNQNNGFLSGNYDLYRFDQQQEREWVNYKAEPFEIESGKGYLYASYDGTTLNFCGTEVVGEFNEDVWANVVDVTLGQGWNLIGNPFSNEPYADLLTEDLVDFKDYYKINDNGNELVPGDPYSAYGDPIYPMQGVLVWGEEDGEVVFFSGEVNRGGAKKSLSINIRKNRSNVIDRAMVRFNGGGMLPKFQLNPRHTKVYITEGNKDYAVVRSASEAELPVSFRASENGTYTLSVEVNNVEMNYLHLIDNMTGADVDLLATPSYTFEAKTSDYASRFRLMFSANSISEDADGDNAFAYFNGSNWTVSNMGEATLQVVDVMGRVLSSETLSGNAEVNINQPTGVYMLRLVNGDNVKVQKVVVR